MPQASRERTKTDDLAEVRAILRSDAPRGHFYAALLGLRTYESVFLIEAVRRGFSFSAFSRFQRNTSLSQAALVDLIQIPLRTLTRRKEQGRLGPEESDRLLRASRVFGRALELFEGDADAARTWLSAPSVALGGRTPLDLASSEVGAIEVERLIGRLEHGIPS